METEKKKNKKQEEETTTENVEVATSKQNEELDKLKEELAEEKAKSMRIQADMINFKKRKEDELASFYKYANADLIESLLPTIDNFERALNAKVSDEASDEVKKYQEGFKMIYTNLVKLLNDYDVKEIDSLGLEFDPNYHQAVLTEEDDTKPSNVIVEVLQKGYTYKDKVIRPAMVKVNK